MPKTVSLEEQWQKEKEEKAAKEAAEKKKQEEKEAKAEQKKQEKAAKEREKAEKAAAKKQAAQEKHEQKMRDDPTYRYKQEQKQLKADSKNLLYMKPPKAPGMLARLFNTSSARKFKEYHNLIGVSRPGLGWRMLDSVAKFWGARVPSVAKYERDYQSKGNAFRQRNLRERAIKQRQEQKAKQQTVQQPKLQAKQPVPKDLQAEFQKKQLEAMQKQNELLQKQIEQQTKMMEMLQQKVQQPEKTQEQPSVDSPERSSVRDAPLPEKVELEKGENKPVEKQAIEADEKTKASSFKQAETGAAQKSEQDLMQRMETAFGKENVSDNVRANLSKLFKDDDTARKNMGKEAAKGGMVKLENKDVSSMLAYNKVMQRINNGDKSVISELNNPNAAKNIQSAMSRTQDAKYLSGERKAEDLQKVFNDPTELNKATDRANKQIEDTYAKLFGKVGASKTMENPQASKLPENARQFGKYNYKMPGDLSMKTIPGADEQAAKDERKMISQKIAMNSHNPKLRNMARQNEELEKQKQQAKGGMVV